MSEQRRILWVDVSPEQRDTNLAPKHVDGWTVEVADGPVDAVARISTQRFDAVYFDTGQHDKSAVGSDDFVVRLLQSEYALNGMPEGVVLLDADLRVTWCNKKAMEWSACDEVPTGQSFYSLLGDVEIIGPDFCPFHTALVTGGSSSSTLVTSDHRYYEVHVAPLKDVATERAALVATISDVTREALQQQKLAAIHQAGRMLADLKPDEIFAMDTQARIELLKDNIRHYTADLLNVEVIEIRLLEKKSGNLMPLLSVGINQEAADRQLYARPQGNGVTGYVAATGRSYLCADTHQDPLYLEAFEGARSSLTVPLILHDTVIGTINVESNQVNAFDENDMQFLEIFSRDVAQALNTLELLVAQRNEAAHQSCEAIHSAVALPINQILNDAVNVIEKYIGEDPEAVERLQRIVRNARDIRQVIQKIGQTMAPVEALPAGCSKQLHEKLKGRRILVVDSDLQVLSDAHNLLEKFGCTVESAHSGDEAVKMYRNSRIDAPYDVVIAAIKLPDYSGYQLMLRLKQITDPVPIALMTGFGWDPGHSIVKARQDGLHPKCLLYKPFKLAQLLNVVEFVIDQHQAQAV
ncbi:MAG: two-component system response regulator [Pirellulaceae bacterium]|nr:MAG: two-component system response regulator [Pirellulaceae bacterium]